MASGPKPTWLLFDGECRVCSAVARWVHALDLRGRLRIRPIQESQDLLRGVPEGERLHAMRAVAPDGRMAAGPDAIPVVLAALSAGPNLEGLLRSSPPAMSALSGLYRVLVMIRGQLTCGVPSVSSAARSPR